MGKPFSPERLANIRRMRKARRLYKKQPVFAFAIMVAEYPEYTIEKFWDDLRYRRPPKKKKGKSSLVRYGRYRRMEQLNGQYLATGNLEYGLQAVRLRRNMTKPYRVLVRVSGQEIEYSFSPLIPIERIENLVRELSNCKDLAEADKLIEISDRHSHIN